MRTLNRRATVQSPGPEVVETVPTVALWVIAVLVAGVFVPGGGVLFTALVHWFGKPLRRRTYIVLYSVGVAMILIDVLTFAVTLWLPPIVHFY